MTHPSILSNPIASFLDHAALAPHQAHKALTLWPLVWPENAEPSGPTCVPLREALERGDVHIDEVSEQGSVPVVHFENRGKQPVLFLFGEEIVGAKQNRVANATFLVPPVSSVLIDVSCVEAGRWDRRGSHGFHGSREVVSRDLRSKMARSVHASMITCEGFRADQEEVWGEIDARLGSSHTTAETEAWGDYAESRESDLAEMDRAFRPVERQVGFVAMQGRRVVGLEAVGCSEFFAASFRTLLRSYTIDAVEEGISGRRERRRGGPEPFDGPEPLLAALREAPVSWAPSRGIGSDLRVDTPRVSACALACEGLVHLTAFPAEAE
ncbi:MAG: hypothetical protein QF890_10125 [Myxococcota bacterium]|jgi:hypothetical protein|nr:hypothetical protein [bacterium]MDP6075278.1 hypothetical protein [Myxococcota bacterium]MDP6244685.1 hypothetical protein [Myxococcota bacterium]MDP7074871.1 hypothetical protein [Myxococcota bacterium]MDP7301339.1 hypothetical protein [Myxococcota bacterium]